MTAIDLGSTLTVSEVFGPTVQGEGPSAGRRAMFLRLGRCNLDCKWCDTPYTWDWQGKNGVVFKPADELRDVSVRELVDHFAAMLGDDLLVITGGEPMIQQRRIVQFLDVLDHDDVEIETNGTQRAHARLGERVRFNVSPKLSGSGVARERAIDFDVLRDFDGRFGASFKFVCVDERDVAEVDQLVKQLPLARSSVWIMPEGRSVDALTAHVAVAELAIARGYNVSGRLHVTLWGDQRGR